MCTSTASGAAILTSSRPMAARVRTGWRGGLRARMLAQCSPMVENRIERAHRLLRMKGDAAVPARSDARRLMASRSSP